jgi:hypothetical protein
MPLILPLAEALLEDRVKSLETSVKEGAKRNIELEQDNLRLQAEIEESNQVSEENPSETDIHRSTINMLYLHEATQSKFLRLTSTRKDEKLVELTANPLNLFN